MPKGIYERKPGWGSWSKGRTDLGGPTDPRWKRVEKTCAICGVGFFVKRSHAKLRKTCSRKCHAEYRSRYLVGKNAPSWRGGMDRRKDYRGMFKEKMKQEVKKRDGNCQVCKSKRHLQVHHLNFVRSDNRLDNFILLCASCHSSVEKFHRSMLKRGVGIWNKIIELTRLGV